MYKKNFINFIKLTIIVIIQIWKLLKVKIKKNEYKKNSIKIRGKLKINSVSYKFIEYNSWILNN